MTIGIIGAGNIGQAFAGHLARAGYDTILSNSRGPDSLREMVKQLGPRIRAGTVPEAAASEIVVLALNWQGLPSALAGLPGWQGRIVIDATNPVVPPGLSIADLGGRSSSEIVADLVPGARLVKTLNTLLARVLAADPGECGGRRVLFMCGDAPAAKAKVAELLDRLGFATVDLGTLAGGARLQQFPGGSLPTLNLIKVS
jgi:8-hydroxy-5-deazaflavin:NADPH oxidoreductase